ncbi:hypothetical protein QOZ80_2BG0185790 [Eleusine coracana subsp. coracana]|nr:hypothetical protein QOZ80_2BG0185790 [Eleusine coracana subsp. coracana]
MPVSGRTHVALQCLVAAVLLAGFAAMLFCLLFQPGLIDYTINSAAATINSARLHNRLHGGERGVPHRRRVAHNPNHGVVSVLYDRAEFHVSYSGFGQEELASDDRPVFRELNPEDTWIDVSLPAGELTIDILIRGRVRFRFAGITTWPFQLRAHCTQVVINPMLPFQDQLCDVVGFY